MKRLNLRTMILVVLSLVLFLAFLRVGLAEENPIRLKEMVVTATRTEEPSLSVPAFVTVLSHKKLVRTGARNLIEALKFSPGIIYRAYGPLGISHGGMNSEINLRGTRRGTLVMINGIPITVPTNYSYDLDQIPLDMVEKVEIVKGAASTLYGSEALAGVINIITKKPEEMKRFVSISGGNRGYYDGGFVFSYKKLAILGSYKHLGDIGRLSRNYRRKYKYEFKGFNTYNSYLTYQILDSLRLNYSYCYQNARFNRIYWNASSRQYDQENDKHFFNLIYEKDSLKAKGFFNYDDLKYRHITEGYTSTTRSSTSGIDVQNFWELGSSARLLLGFTYKYDWGDTSRYGKHRRNNIAPFIQISYELFPRFTAIFGAREQWVIQSKAKDHDKFLPQFQLLYRINPKLSWYANIGKAFKMPTFSQLYYHSPWMVGNPNLKPEKGWTYETGIKFRNPKLSFSIAFYYMEFDDKIEWQFNPKTYKSSPVNVSEFTNEGVEYELSYLLSDCFEISIGGYIGDPENENDEKERAGAKFQSSFSIGYHGKRVDANINSILMTSREYGLRNFYTVGINLSYKLPKGALTISADNIFDRKNVISGKMSPTPYYEYFDMPASFRIGYKIEF